MGRENRQLERKERLRRRKERRRLMTALREKAAGLVPPVSRTSSNRKSPHKTVQEEQASRTEAVVSQAAVILFLDGLYPNGPAMALCREHHWGFMMVLQDGSLPSVWAEFNGLKDLEQDNVNKINWGNRVQCFRRVNQIEYRYGDHERKRLVIHLVVCEEAWWDIDKSTNQSVKGRSRHAWVSSDPINPKYVHGRCELEARRRWGIEAGFLVEKHHGYQYEHRFAWNWNV